MQFSDLTYGVEIEAFYPSQISDNRILTELIKSKGIDIINAGYSHEVSRNKWKVCSDASVEGYRDDSNRYMNGVEIVSPILKGEDGFKQIDLMCKILKELGCKVDKHCGLHVHIGIQDIPSEKYNTLLKNVLKTYLHHEKVIDNIMTPDRRNNSNTYCQSLNSLTNYEAIDNYSYNMYNFFNGNRYIKVNIYSVSSYNTIEFRHHNGTLNSLEIIPWIQFCQKLVVRATDKLPIEYEPVEVEIDENINVNRPLGMRYYTFEREALDIFIRRGNLTTPELHRECSRYTGSLGTILRKWNIPFTTKQEGRIKRFYLSTGNRKIKKKVYNIPNANLDNLANLIGLSTFEKVYFENRLS